ncbi:glycosyltransferase family 4 protein [Patescibacteria group bacterium]
MRIGIDARLINQTGVGRYIRNLISNLARIDSENQYIVFVLPDSKNDIVLPNENWEKHIVDIKWHSLKEQLMLPFIFSTCKLDLLHVPYFNVPVFYPGKFVITVHDLTILHFNTGKATTLPKFIYQLKRLAYKFVLYASLKRASYIFAVSQNTKKEVCDHYKIESEKIIVTYEGFDKNLYSQKVDVKNPLVNQPYLLYVGNAYPHKNLENLVEAISLLTKKYSFKKITLVMVGKSDYFYKQLQNKISDTILDKKVHFFGEASDSQLQNLYYNAQALVFPSFMEGFGLPVLEANYLGCAVICSDIPVFREILGDNGIYFDPHKPEDIAATIGKFLAAKNKYRFQKKVDYGKFSWEKMARDVYKSYKKIKI